MSFAKKSRRVVLQPERPLGKDEASRKAFELYLELDPNDQDVKTALDEIIRAVPQNSGNQQYPKTANPDRLAAINFTSKKWYGLTFVLCLLVIGIAVHFPVMTS